MHVSRVRWTPRFAGHLSLGGCVTLGGVLPLRGRCWLLGGSEQTQASRQSCRSDRFRQISSPPPLPVRTYKRPSARAGKARVGSRVIRALASSR